MKLDACFALIIAFIFIQCNPDKETRVSNEGLNFSTTDPSELFFKNVRQLFYDKEVMREANRDIYRLKGRSQSTDHPMVNLAIVINWRVDEAYLLLEPNALLSDSDSLIVQWRDPATGEEGVHMYSSGDKLEQLTWISQVYHGLLDRHTFTILLNRQTYPFLDDQDQREAFRITVFDFLRLVEVI